MVEDIYFDRDGHRRNVEVNAHPIFNKRGELTQVIEYLVGYHRSQESRVCTQRERGKVQEDF